MHALRSSNCKGVALGVTKRACRRCNQSRRVPDEIGERGYVCFACQQEARRLRGRRGYRRIKADPERWAAYQAYYEQYRKKNRTKRQSYELEYKRQLMADPARLNAKRKRERERMRRRMADPETRERLRLARRKSYYKVKQDPNRWAQLMADQRMRHRLKAELDRREVRQVASPHDLPHHSHAETLPSAPLVRVIQKWLLSGDGGLKLLAGMTTTPDIKAATMERRLRSILSGEQENVSVAIADRICIAIGTHLALIYDEDEAA